MITKVLNKTNSNKIDAVIGGAKDEFIFSPRLDNLMSSYSAIISLIEASSEESLSEEKNCRMAVLYDNVLKLNLTHYNRKKLDHEVHMGLFLL